MEMRWRDYNDIELINELRYWDTDTKRPGFDFDEFKEAKDYMDLIHDMLKCIYDTQYKDKGYGDLKLIKVCR